MQIYGITYLHPRSNMIKKCSDIPETTARYHSIWIFYYLCGKKQSVMKHSTIPFFAIDQIQQMPIIKCNGSRFISPQLAVLKSVLGMKEIMRLANMKNAFNQPYRMKEGRIAIVLSGTGKIRINLIEHTLKRNDLVIVSSGVIGELTNLSPDFDWCLIACSDQLLQELPRQGMVQRYLQGRMIVHLPLKEKECRRILQIFDLLWEILHDEDRSLDLAVSVIHTLFKQTEIYELPNTIDRETSPRLRQEEVFDRFIELVNNHAVHERDIGFYADKLCITPRYMSTLIRQASGRTIMEWINEAVIQEAKIQLRYSDKPIYQLAEELHFANVSFFCKFFRQKTGYTPTGYRQARHGHTSG